MSEIFNKENFVETFIWKNTDNPDSLSKIRASVEYIIAFEKKIEKSNAYIGKDTEKMAMLLYCIQETSINHLHFQQAPLNLGQQMEKFEKGKPDRAGIVNDFDVINGINAQDVTLIEFVWSQETVNEELNKGTYFLVKSNKFSIRFQRLEATSMAPEKYIDNISFLIKSVIGVGTNEDATTHLKKMG